MKIDKNQNRPYTIEEYNPEWVNKFQELKKMLDKVFGSKALDIEHVGSTSVPGMKAKPIVDILITVKKMETFDTEKEAMVRRGYEWTENYIAPNTLIFYKTDLDTKVENMHICEKDSPKAIQFISMRNYLRTHPDKAKEYSELKEKLNKQFPNVYIAYREGKNQFLEDLTKLALEECKKNPQA